MPSIKATRSRSVQAFYLLLPVNGVADVAELFVVHEAIDSVALREAFCLARLMFQHSPAEIVGDTGVNMS